MIPTMTAGPNLIMTMELSDNGRHPQTPQALALEILDAQLPGARDNPAVKAKILTEIVDQQNQDIFKGFKVGFGFAYTASGTKDRVKEVALANGIVRVTKADNDTTRALAEVHYFLTPDCRFLGLVDKGKWGIGPFVAEDISSGGVGGLGFGIMLGLKQPDNSPFIIPIPGQAASSHASWNIGVGAFLEPAVKVLGDGIVANQPLPAGKSTDVRTKEISRWGFLLMTSFSF